MPVFRKLPTGHTSRGFNEGYYFHPSRSNKKIVKFTARVPTNETLSNPRYIAVEEKFTRTRTSLAVHDCQVVSGKDMVKNGPAVATAVKVFVKAFKVHRANRKRIPASIFTKMSIKQAKDARPTLKDDNVRLSGPLVNLGNISGRFCKRLKESKERSRRQACASSLCIKTRHSQTDHLDIVLKDAPVRIARGNRDMNPREPVGINADLACRIRSSYLFLHKSSAHPYPPAPAILTLAMSDTVIRRRRSSAALEPIPVSGTVGETGRNTETTVQRASSESRVIGVNANVLARSNSFMSVRGAFLTRPSTNSTGRTATIEEVDENEDIVGHAPDDQGHASIPHAPGDFVARDAGRVASVVRPSITPFCSSSC
ncbi:hypothetical protein BJ322DRAFT_1016706 [Thelephora terrestris]|uniref:Uncharacterized protein n=1 Tax=Thelephora terrestris TaxID=56493 RepID=A0A9P6HTB2_9AGAM|nr:hypothetical protein BJ322DRAFT_1016706 [Thelephora terrestris]